ncbi:hypothetical protein FWF48_03760 [Candidatus Saccharibacteria bacterium]|nr:hypothetical protein [Candidatus Saccharibacteria bacterium]
MDGQSYISLDNKKPKNKWKIVGIIFIILALLLGGAGGFIAYKFLNQKDELDSKQTALDKAKADLKIAQNKEAEDNTTVAETESANYLTIKEWGIKFKIPDTLKNVTYTITGDSALVVAANNPSKLTPFTGYACSGQKSNAAIARSKQDDITVNGNKMSSVKIGDYYYAVTGRQQSMTCGDTTQNSEDEFAFNIITANIVFMVGNPQAV